MIIANEMCSTIVWPQIENEYAEIECDAAASPSPPAGVDLMKR